MSCVQHQPAPLQGGLGWMVACLPPTKDKHCHQVLSHPQGDMASLCSMGRHSLPCPVPLHPHPNAGELWVHLAWLEICPSCGGGSGTQVPQTGTNCPHHQKVPGAFWLRGRNWLRLS